jgi:hypothetical protein
VTATMSPYAHFDNRCAAVMQDDIQGINAVYPNGSSSGQLAIMTSELPNANSDVDYSMTLEASGGTGGYHWSLTSGQVPIGMQLGVSGLLYGKTNAPGTFAFTIHVVDSSGSATQRSFSLVVNGAGSTPIIESVEYRKKKLWLTGQNFRDNALVYVDGEELTATLSGNTLVTEKRKQKPRVHQAYVVNPDGRLSNTFQFVVE